jgi:acetoin utilization protein AcuB
MTANPTTIQSDMLVSDALDLMRKKSIHHLPVVDDMSQLTGIVSEKDLLNAFSSSITSSILWKTRKLLRVLKVKKVMAQKLITITEDDTLEEAAIVMFSCKIGGLPVIRRKSLIGIITKTDLYQVFLKMLGTRSPGVRITVLVPNVKGTMAMIAKAIVNAGGNIVGFGASEAIHNDEGLWDCVLKVQGVTRDKLLDTVKPLVNLVTDVRIQ